MSGVQPFERRYVIASGVKAGKVVLLLKRVDEDDSGCVWWAPSRQGAFGKLDIRASRIVKKSKDDFGDAEIVWEEIATPGEDEKAAILRALEAHLRGDAAPQRNAAAGGSRTAPTPRDFSHPISQFDPKGRGKGRRFRRFYRKAQQAGPANVVVGTCVSGGVVMKIWENLEAGYGLAVKVFYNAKGEKTGFLLKIEKWFGDVEKMKSKFAWLKEFSQDFYNTITSLEWDSVVLILGAGYLVYKFCSSGGDSAADQLKAQHHRQNERMEQILNKHRMDSRRDNESMMNDFLRRPGNSGGGGLGGLEQATNDFEAVIRQDAGKGAKADSGGVSKKESGFIGRLQGKVGSLLLRAKNPLERIATLVNNLREVCPWNMPKRFQARLAAGWATVAYAGGQLASVNAKTYRRDHGLEGCTAFNAYEAICDISDAFVMDDRWDDLFNSHGYERLARWGFGSPQVYDECRSEKDWKGDRKTVKTRWELMKRYHPTAAALGGVNCEEAETEVVEGMKEDALFNKFLSKVDEEAV